MPPARCCCGACRVAATAVVYFRRLYAGSSFSVHDPHLVAPGCLYLASKVRLCFLVTMGNSSSRSMAAAASTECKLQSAWSSWVSYSSCTPAVGACLALAVHSKAENALSSCFGVNSSCFGVYSMRFEPGHAIFNGLQVEESVVAGKMLLASMRRLRPAWQYELKDLLDMEMVRRQTRNMVFHASADGCLCLCVAPASWHGGVLLQSAHVKCAVSLSWPMHVKSWVRWGAKM
jgi:hypothetical protein